MKDVRDVLLVGRTSEGTPVLRPTSPHLQVYRFKITMLQSILHRITGAALSAGTILLVVWLMAAAGPADFYHSVQALIASPIGLLIMFGFTVALFFHLAAGLRHLAWDAIWGFEKPEFNATSIWIFAFTVIATVFVWVIGYFLVV